MNLSIRHTVTFSVTLKSEAIHQTSLSRKCSFLILPIPLCFNVFSIVPRVTYTFQNDLVHFQISMMQMQECQAKSFCLSPERNCSRLT